jgi:SAM-dependent methyltransferase
MKEIEFNKIAWGKTAEKHYENFKKSFLENNYKFNPIVEEEIGDVSGKKILHLQCNTGADSIYLAKKGAIVTGVDLATENIYFAKKLSEELNVKNVEFVASDILEADNILNGEYDIVLTTDGCIGWLPDLNKWGKVISKFLKKDGFFYLHDSHPTFLIFDTEQLDNAKLEPKYPYFKTEPDKEDYIGGYASEAVESENYFWGHQLSEVINGLANSGLFITYFKEFDYCIPGMGGKEINSKGFSYYPGLEEKIPLTMSIKAVKK